LPPSCSTLSLHDALPISGDFAKSMEYLRKSLAYFEGAPLKSRIYALNISACYNYMGEAMRKQKRFEEALDLYRQAVEICENNHRSEEHTSELQSRFDLVC